MSSKIDEIQKFVDTVGSCGLYPDKAAEHIRYLLSLKDGGVGANTGLYCNGCGLLIEGWPSVFRCVTPGCGRSYHEPCLLSHCAEDKASRKWSAEPPTEQGWYWHWDGNQQSAPFPLSILKHGAGDQRCFVSMGQAGLSRSVECDEYGGFWQPVTLPATASTETSERCVLCPLCFHSQGVDRDGYCNFRQWQPYDTLAPCGCKCPPPSPAPEQVGEQKGERRSGHFSNEAIDKGTFPDHISANGTAYYSDGTLPAPATTVAQPEAEGGPRPEPVPSTPLCPVHQSLEDQGKLECEIGGNNCVACSLNERAELLALLAPLAARDGSEDSVSVLRRVVETQEVARCAQALLTALNVGDVHGESPLHLKLREVMIAYRSVCARAEPVPVGVEAAAIPPSTVEGEANDPM